MKSEVLGQGSPVILVPGGLTGWLSWKPHAEQLAAHHKVVRMQLLSVDLGLRNEPLPEHYSVDTETGALARALDQIDIEDADFAAWSYGGEITLNFALNNPSRTRSLTLIEPPAIWVLRSRGPLSKEALEEQKHIQSLGSGDVSESQLEWFLHFAGIVPTGVDPRKLPQWPSWMEHRQSLRTQDVPFRHHDSIERVRNFRKPVLLFKGEGSSPFLHQIIDILGEEFPNAQVRMLPGGHAPHLVSIGEFMTILNAFIAESRG